MAVFGGRASAIKNRPGTPLTGFQAEVTRRKFVPLAHQRVVDLLDVYEGDLVAATQVDGAGGVRA